MRKIISVVYNLLSHDTRVLKTGRALDNISEYFSFVALQNSDSNKNIIFDCIDNIPVLRVKQDFPTFYSENEMEKSIKKGRIRHYISFTTIIRFITHIKFYFQKLYIMYKAYLIPDYNIIYCNDFNTLIAGFMASRKKKAKIIYDSHELWFDQGYSVNSVFKKCQIAFEKFMELIIIRKCNAVITVSSGIAEELAMRYGIKKPFLIRNLVEHKPIINKKLCNDIRNANNIPDNAIVIVYQGSLIDSRGIPELIDSISILPEKFHLLLMGTGLSKENTEKITKSKRIHYLGMVPEAELHKYTSAGDIGIHPLHKSCINNILAFPNKFSQYMNAGLALALFDASSSREIINKYDCGVLFEPGNTENIIEAIRTIVQSGKLEYYKRNSKKAFEEEYCWEKEKNTLIKIIKTIY